MYESFFGFSRRPFTPAPQPEHYFPAVAIEDARKRFVRCIERGDGPGLLVGPAGTGKTMLCQVLAEQFREKFAVAQLASGRLCTRRALLQALLFELGLPYREMEEGELRLSLIDHLVSDRPDARPMLLLVDEAHTMPLRLLEEIRMTTNLVRGGQSRVRLVLAGSPALEERFASPKLESFNQRVAVRCYLDAFNHDDTVQYVRAQLGAAGGKPDEVFAPEALEAVRRATDGVPRLINQLCDHALLLASTGGVQCVGASGIEEAWADLQQLPAPWPTGSEKFSSEHKSEVIEFGTLDDAPEDAETIRFSQLAPDGATSQAAPGRTPGDEDPRSAQFAAEQHAWEFDGLDDDVPYQADASRVEQHLASVEQHLADMDEDFEPAGSIGPEVEVSVPTASDPFGEMFDEEEVVLDHFAAIEEELRSQSPRVTSAEGRALSQVLAPYAVASDARNQWQTSPRKDAPSAQPIGDVVEYDPVMPEPEDELDRLDQSVDESFRHGPFRHNDTGRPSIGVVGTDDDDDLLVIEDEIDGDTAAPRARRQEYSQLFAKLRRR